MDVALSAEPHEFMYPAKIIVVVSDSLVPLYEKRFVNLEVAARFIVDMLGRGIRFSKAATRYQILVMLPKPNDQFLTNPFFNRQVWGAYLINPDQLLQDYFTRDFN